MEDIKGIFYTTAEFDKDGNCLLAPVLNGEPRELIIVSHGWNNDRKAAEHLYEELFTNFEAVHSGDKSGLAIIGVIWPSKKFNLEDDAPPVRRMHDGAAASTAGAGAAQSRESMERSFEKFRATFAESVDAAELEALHGLLPRLENEDAQTEFVERLRTIVAEQADQVDLDDPADFLVADDPQGVFIHAMQAPSDVAALVTHEDAGDGSGAGLGDAFDDLSNAVSSLLNTTTYYTMKKRAGTVGAVGLAPLIDKLARRETLERIHLVGHSFGARLVTAAAMHSTTPKLHSLSLLQAAFSHNSFAPHGYFRKVVRDGRVAGPIIITHTPNDRAVGKAYAIASRVSRDATSDIGDPNDKYGGLGCNGARKMEEGEVSSEAITLLPEQGTYTLMAKRIHNLESSAFIANHGAVTGREVAWAISQAMSL